MIFPADARAYCAAHHKWRWPYQKDPTSPGGHVDVHVVAVDEGDGTECSILISLVDSVFHDEATIKISPPMTVLSAMIERLVCGECPLDGWTIRGQAINFAYARSLQEIST